MNTLELRKTAETMGTEDRDELLDATAQIRQELSEVRGQLGEILNQMPRGKGWAAPS